MVGNYWANDPVSPTKKLPRKKERVGKGTYLVKKFKAISISCNVQIIYRSWIEPKKKKVMGQSWKSEHWLIFDYIKELLLTCYEW